ncbi:SseB family protein [Roseovarius salinarum]|uniref:SseB family protein n=1 Tax=Roseovarius salinarum TaxID=1981892 RepID=UPI000C32B279|nr:SseB family protein [Roseovarius salinarum]
MQAAPDDGAARLAFYDRLAGSELFLMLTEEPEGEDISPEVFALEDAGYVLAFDREARLARFAGRPVPYAALSGRAICDMLAPAGLGLGVNLDVAPSALVLPPDAVRWLAETAGRAPDAVEARLRAVHVPEGLPESLLAALDARLASAAGMAASAWLAGVTHEDDTRGHLLAVIDAHPGAQPGIATAVSEALAFSGLDTGTIDVAFIAADDPLAERLAAVGLRFDLPEPKARQTTAPQPPGRDPDNPPILR